MSALNLHRDRWVLWLIVAIAGLMILWVPAAYVLDPLRFTVLTPAAQVGVEGASAISRIFAAIVLLLLPKAQFGRSIRWVASGLVVMGIGAFLFGSLPHALGYSIDANETVYGSLMVGILAGSLFVIGLLPVNPPRLTWLVILAAMGAVLLLKTLTLTRPDLLPALWNLPVAELDSDWLRDPLRDVTGWYWVKSGIVVIIALLSALGAARQFSRRALPGWLVIAMILWASAQIHHLLWPSIYSLVLTTTDFMRLAFAAVIVIAGIFSLRRTAMEYERLFELEHEMLSRLARQAAVKDDFTSMVAHELGSPVAAIRRYVELADSEGLDEAQRRSLQAIHRETDALRKLVADVQAIKNLELDDFTVDRRAVPVEPLLKEAESFAVTLNGNHTLMTSSTGSVNVVADSVRIGQVLRNLVENAAKYSPHGSPIELHATPNGRTVLFEVIDHGYGVHAADVERIFRKFERGRYASTDQTAPSGAGLGLYLSQKIVQAHGSMIRVDSSPEGGSRFTFTLEIAS